MDENSPDRYSAPVNGLDAEHLRARLKLAVADVQTHFPPKTGVLVVAFDVGERGGMAYAATGRRADMIKLLREFLLNLEREAKMS